VFREIHQTREALRNATEMAQLRKEATKKAAKNPEDLKTLLTASKDQLEAEVEVVKAELAYRVAHVQLLSLIGR
jgi:hypothetical protein